MFAVVAISGKQYKVKKDDILSVDKIDGVDNSELIFDQVLLVDNDGKVEIGTPYVKGVQVKAMILRQLKDEKVHIRRYKQKVRYRKNTGFRARLTEIQILSI
jgi:large subunit ribosomal protein L21